MPTAMQRVDLGAGQIEVEMRMHLADLGRMIGDAVVAFGKDRDGVDMRVRKGVGERLGVKARADVRNQRRGVKIEMNLTKTHLLTPVTGHTMRTGDIKRPSPARQPLAPVAAGISL